jgi:1-acyl-sn-glycerol-3-phosphate acyltransferase
VALFPEGTTTDGKQVGHFHSALFQPAIDTGVRLCPIALRYQDDSGEPSVVAPFTGDTTLALSIWRILRCRQLNTLVVFTPAQRSADMNRRALARSAQQTIAQELLNIAPKRPEPQQPASFALPQTVLSAQSAYVLLLDPLLNHLPK